MERIPYCILCEILTSVGPINEIYPLSLVCKEWYQAMKHSLHLGTLKGRSMNIKKIWKCRVKFLSKWKLRELNFQGSCIHPSKSFIALISTSEPKVLNFSRFREIQYYDWVGKLCEKKKKYGNNDSFDKVEELRVTNIAREGYDYEYEGVVGYIYYNGFCELFPKIKKLYSGNIGINEEGISTLFRGFKMLEFLDLSNCSPEIVDMEENSKALNYILSSNIKTLFISLKDSNIADIIRSKGINVITENLDDVIEKVIEEQSTSKLEEWFKSGGDINLLNTTSSRKWPRPIGDLIDSGIGASLLEKIIRFMINHGANVNYDYFCRAIAKNMVWLVKFLLNSGCNIWYLDKDDKQEEFIIKAAEVANETKDYSLLDIFVDLGLHKLDLFGNSSRCNPYCTAFYYENIELFSYLIRKGFPFWKCKNSVSPKHMNPFIFYPKILDYALFSGNYSLDLFPFDWVYDGLRYCINENKDEEAIILLEYLIPKGLKRKEKQIIQENKSAFFYSLYNSLVILAYKWNRDCKKMLEYLIEKGFDLNNICKHETPLLIQAAQYGNLEMMIFFYDHGAKVNQQDPQGDTALHLAAGNGHEEVVKQLVSWGASVDIKNNNNRTPLEIAEMRNRTEICLLLQNYSSEHKTGCAII